MPQPGVDCCHDFAAEYEQNAHPAFRELEQSVLGCDYGGTSWTTRAQADDIGESLGLGAGTRMLELGSGAGWPSLYLAGKSSCELTLLDIPVNALVRAQTRAREESVTRVEAVSASGVQLPFLTASFDALCHSDVLCCLPEKQEMLAECRRVARQGARMLFYVIALAEGLSRPGLAEAIEAGPGFVDMPADYSTLLNETGWRLLNLESVNDAYLNSLQRMVEGLEHRQEIFGELMGTQEFQEMLHRRRHQVSAVERGLLVREMFLAQAV